jgi:membrane protease YdiL (CAAX protease family)
MSTLVNTRPETDAQRRSGPPRAPSRVVSWRFITLATAGAFALITLLNVSFRVFHDFYVTVYLASAHLITPTLIIGGVFFAVTMIGLISFGELRAHDLGWQWSKVGPALVLTAGIWIAFQLVELGAALAPGTGPRLSPDWTAAGWATAVGVLLGVALGVAPGEETFFRGFLLTQLRMKFAHMNATTAVTAAVILSNLAFALYHLPNLVLGNSGKVGTTPSDIAVQVGVDFLVGVVFAGLYLRTGNLFLVIGIHALQDAGTSLVATPIDPGLVIFTLTVVLLLATFAPARRGRST